MKQLIVPVWQPGADVSEIRADSNLAKHHVLVVKKILQHGIAPAPASLKVRSGPVHVSANLHGVAGRAAIGFVNLLSLISRSAPSTGIIAAHQKFLRLLAIKILVILEDDSVPGETHRAEQADKNHKSVHRTTSRRKPLQQAWQQDLNIKAIFQKSANWPSSVIKAPNVLMPMNGTILREISTEATDRII